MVIGCLTKAAYLDVKGKTMIDMILFPSSYFDIDKVDEDLQKEYEAVVATGSFDVALFGYDEWFNNNKKSSYSDPYNARSYKSSQDFADDKYEEFYDYEDDFEDEDEAYDAAEDYWNDYND